MKARILTAALITGLLLTGCGATPSEEVSAPSQADTAQTEAPTEEQITEAETEAETEPAKEHETAPQLEVGYEGMTAVGAEALKEGEYHINVDSSSSMFKIADCILYVTGDGMTADLIINSQSYDYLFMGTGKDAEAGNDLISYTVNDEGQSVFTVPVEALDKEIECAALSAKKQEWYDRHIVFRADSLPDEAFAESRYVTAADLGLADGEYSVEVTLEGGSGKASVESPATVTVTGGEASARIVWSSDKYDYMLVDGEKYLPEITDGHSVFEIPVIGFDYKMPVSADTTAMSVPYEIEYTLRFDSSTLTQNGSAE